MKTPVKFNVSIQQHTILKKNLLLDERSSETNRLYPKTPSADTVGMAFNARVKLNQNSERQMIGLS